jgi:hypothetical protein
MCVRGEVQKEKHKLRLSKQMRIRIADVHNLAFVRTYIFNEYIWIK